MTDDAEGPASVTHEPAARRAVATPDSDPTRPHGAAPDYRAVFAALSAPKVLLATDLTVLDVNDAYLDMLETPARALVGRPLNDGFDFSPEDRERVDRVVASLRRVLQTGRIELLEPLRIDVPGRRPGEWVEHHWLMTNIPVFDASGRVTALLHRAEDVTDIVQTSQRAAVDKRIGLDAAVVDHAMHMGSSVGRFQESLDRERRAALQLQDSILTPPAQPAGLRIDVRYRPASRDMHVGGDWYDAFEQSCGCTFVVVGDVVGHDIRAAAAMGQLRGVMRGARLRLGRVPRRDPRPDRARGRGARRRGRRDRRRRADRPARTHRGAPPHVGLRRAPAARPRAVRRFGRPAVGTQRPAARARRGGRASGPHDAPAPRRHLAPLHRRPRREA